MYDVCMYVVMYVHVRIKIVLAIAHTPPRATKKKEEQNKTYICRPHCFEQQMYNDLHKREMKKSKKNQKKNRTLQITYIKKNQKKNRTLQITYM